MPKPAGRLADNVVHGPPVLGAPCVTVLIGGKPTWQVADQHTCPIPNAPPPVGPGTPHGPGITSPPGAITVLIANKPAMGLGDQIMEPGAVMPPMTPNPVIMGCPTVLVG